MELKNILSRLNCEDRIDLALKARALLSQILSEDEFKMLEFHIYGQTIGSLISLLQAENKLETYNKSKIKSEALDLMGMGLGFIEALSRLTTGYNYIKFGVYEDFLICFESGKIEPEILIKEFNHIANANLNRTISTLLQVKDGLASNGNVFRIEH